MQGRFVVLVLVLLASSLPGAAATARLVLGVTSTPTCNALTTTSLQLKGGKVGSVEVTSSDGCCEACAKQAGCQLFFLKDNTCEMFGLDKGPVTASIMYQTNAGLLTKGNSLVEHSDECDGNVWLFKGIAFDGVVKATAADPYGTAQEGGFRNGFTANSWQECCKGALAAPGTTLMQRYYAYRARQYWTWNEADGKCTVKVRPFQAGATVLTMRRAGGVISGMFGNEI